jgi:hypothetical protein
MSEEFEPIRQKTLRPNLTQAEGFILGVSASVVYGLIYWIWTMI